MNKTQDTKWKYEPQGWWPELPEAMGRNKQQMLRRSKRIGQMPADERRKFEARELRAEQKLCRECLEKGETCFPDNWEAVIDGYMTEEITGQQHMRMCRQCNEIPVEKPARFCPNCKKARRNNQFKEEKRRQRVLQTAFVSA